MLFEFKSRATGTVVMTGDVGKKVLPLIGKSPDPKGIITVDQMPAAIAALEAACKREKELAAAARNKPAGSRNRARRRDAGRCREGSGRRSAPDRHLPARLSADRDAQGGACGQQGHHLGRVTRAGGGAAFLQP